MPLDTRQRSQLFTMMQTLLIAIFAVTFFLDTSPRLALPGAVGVAGWILCAAGFILMAAALAAMGRVMQVSPEPKPDGHLVTRGVYARMRHPMYSGIVLVVFGLWLREPRVAVAIAAVALVTLLLGKARFEEQLLRERYPDYDAYRARTWGVLPGI